MTYISGEIKQFTTEHLDNAARLFVSVFNAPPWNHQWTPPKARARLAQALAIPDALGVVLRPDEPLGFLLGYIEEWYDERQFHLIHICSEEGVLADHRMNRMLSGLEAMLRERDIHRLYLFTMWSQQSPRYYVAYGFQLTTSARRLERDL